MNFQCRQTASLIENDVLLDRNERKTFWVVLLSSLMMVLEIVAGHLTGSMALLADGWHMASHAGALGIAYATYRLTRHARMRARFSFGTGKLLPLAGYTSAVILAMLAMLMAYESIKRLFNPLPIIFNEAIAVAVLGLVVNIVSAVILGSGHGPNHDHDHDHHHHHHHDHNLRSAYLHVLADALTSATAIFALVFGKYFQWIWLDAAMGVVGSAVILIWAYGLCREAGAELLDAHSSVIDQARLIGLVEATGAKVSDLHVWRIAPKAVACELVVDTSSPRGAAYYRELLGQQFKLQHLVVEERLKEKGQ